MLLQRRTSQEREQQQTGPEGHTLGLYKVQHTHWSRDSEAELEAELDNMFVNTCLSVMQDFLRWLCVTLLDALFPGASFSKCLMSLHLLCLLGQLFTFSSGTPTNERTVS